MVRGHAVADTAHMNAVTPNATAPQKVAELKRLIGLGQYQVDPYEIADAMLRWAEREVDSVARRRFRSPAQNECSYPRSSRSVSVKVTPAGPSTTAPIHVNEALLVSQAA